MKSNVKLSTNFFKIGVARFAMVMRYGGWGMGDGRTLHNSDS